MRCSINVDHIARIEGHGNVHLAIEDGAVATCEMNVVEPARLFESMVRGRTFSEIPYIASRICGIRSASHVVTDLLAIERVFGIEVSDRTHALRELLIYGSYLQNHATHLFVFAAPDFTALLLGEAVCAPEAYGVNAAVPRTLVRWLIAAEAERAEEPLRAELRAALSAPDADCAGISCALTDFCFYHLVRCGAHPRRILRLARAAFGDAAADADILRAMAALTRCLFRRPAALPDHVALGSSAQALHWPPDAAGSLWGEEIDALRRELT